MNSLSDRACYWLASRFEARSRVFAMRSFVVYMFACSIAKSTQLWQRLCSLHYHWSAKKLCSNPGCFQARARPLLHRMHALWAGAAAAREGLHTRLAAGPWLRALVRGRAAASAPRSATCALGPVSTGPVLSLQGRVGLGIADRPFTPPAATPMFPGPHVRARALSALRCTRAGLQRRRPRPQARPGSREARAGHLGRLWPSRGCPAAAARLRRRPHALHSVRSPMERHSGVRVAAHSSHT